jgi:carbon storage regulator
LLILTRKPVESIKIDLPGIGIVTVTVMRVVGNAVHFGIDAPRHIRVDREEIRRRIERGLAPGEINGNVAEE